ncbi:MAG: hypothetical protein HQK99_04850 [Nitrospirae bacterium]|nr:hypothetical protein [Nitrospirota bacterium]
MMEKLLCPECKGSKVVSGEVVCNMEWRGSDLESETDDCIAEPNKECPVCYGNGYVMAA